MYLAMDSVLSSIGRCTIDLETWIVCLTDGVSDNSGVQGFQRNLMASPQNLHVVSIGINLPHEYQAAMERLSQKYRNPPDEGTKGFFVRADGTTAGLNQAFEVVKSCIPVSQTFDRDGHLTDDDCRDLIREFLPPFVVPDDFIGQSFWIRFLYRRVTVFDNNEDFNYNETNDGLGSSLMRIMLEEVERLLAADHRKEWNEVNHTQLIYDLSNPQAPEFKLICTAPERMDPDTADELENLHLPGFEIPSEKELEDRSVLDRLLSQALDIPLDTEDGTTRLSCIDENRFILTIDFAMKLLNIHERVACGVPCVIEGETGVSKTALTKMYSILRNASISKKTRASILSDLTDIRTQLALEGAEEAPTLPASEQLNRLIETGSEDIHRRLLQLIEEKTASRSPLFRRKESSADHNTPLDYGKAAVEVLEWFQNGSLEQTFFEINVDASLTEDDFSKIFNEVRETAERLRSTDAIVVVFLDGT